MYQVSRALYRELADDIIEGTVPGGGRSTNHERVLHACEATVRRLAEDRYHFANPAKTLIRELRPYFPLSAQSHMRRMVVRYINCADSAILGQFSTGYDLSGNPLTCRATTRRNVPCRRTPLAVNGYCPSHQHLVEAGDERAPRTAGRRRRATLVASGADLG